MTEEQKIQLRKNIDRKILKLYVTEGKSLSEIQLLLKSTSFNFKKIIKESNNTPRHEMINFYTEFTDKRTNDLEFIKQSYKQLNINNNDVRNN